jgi:eukaryotic-like serine/threonine-protein kinase
VLYEMLAGRPPFDSENPVAVLHAHATTPPPPLPPDLPPALADGCGRLLAKDPAARPAPAAAVASMLRGTATVAMATAATAATPLPPTPPVAGTYAGTRVMPVRPSASSAPVRHDRRALGFAAVAVVAVAGLAIWLTTSHPQPNTSSVGTARTTAAATASTTPQDSPSATTTTANTTTAIVGDQPTDTQSALNQVAALVTTDVATGTLNADQGQTLTNQLNQVQNRIDQNRAQQARRTVTTMISEVQNNVQNGDIALTDGTTLLTSLNTLQGFLTANGSGNNGSGN